MCVCVCVCVCVCGRWFACLRVETHHCIPSIMASPSRYPTESNAALPTLNADLVSSAPQLHTKLVPLLHGREQVGMFNVLIPSMQRDDGSLTKSFLYLVGLRELPDSRLRLLFPSESGRVELSCMSPAQRAAYDAWDAQQRAAYACLYSKAEWEENTKQCRKVYSAKWIKVRSSSLSSCQHRAFAAGAAE